MRSPDPVVRAHALRRARRDPDLADLLALSLDDPHEEVRVEAVRALLRIRGQGAARTLVRVAGTDPAPSVRREAVLALGRIAALRLSAEGGGPTDPTP
jgi:HEAT repeat protein